MRKGFLGSLGALLTGAGLAFTQVPYGYAPMMQPYTPGYDYSGYGYGYGYGYPPAYPPGYAPGYPPNYAPGYAPMYGAQPGAVPSGSPAVTPTSGTVPANPVSVQNPTPEQIPVAPTETTPSGPQPPSTAEPPTAPAPAAPGPASPAPPAVQPIPTTPSTPAGPGITLPSEPGSGSGLTPHEALGSSCGSGGCGDFYDRPPRIWGGVEYILWNVKEAPLPVALVTQGDLVQAATAGLPVGALNTPGTSVINPSSFTFNPASGTRLTMGGWINSSRTIGVQCSGFVLQRESSSFLANSPQGGTQVFAIPFLDLATNTESALQISDPFLNPASVSIQNHLFLWGADADGVYHVFGNRWFSFGALGGIRYLDLSESLDYNVNITSSQAAAVPNAYSNFSDRFATRNQFVGGQLGGRVEFRLDRFFLNVTGKVAAGQMYEAVTVNGSNTNNIAVPGTVTTVPIGLFAQSTNIGRQSQDHFAVVPEVQTQLGVEVWRWLRVFGGYNFIYASSVVRPGDQIDHQFNSLNFAPGLTTSFPPALSGPPVAIVQPYRPAVPLATSSFWAHGINVGFELRW